MGFKGEDHEKLHKCGAQTKNYASGQDTISKDGEQKKKPPHPTPNDSRVQPLSRKGRCYFYPETRGNTEASSKPNSKAVQESTETTCCKYQGNSPSKRAHADPSSLTFSCSPATSLKPLQGLFPKPLGLQDCLACLSHGAGPAFGSCNHIHILTDHFMGISHRNG